MDILGIEDIKEQQQIAEFERKMKQKKQKLDKKLTRQKILIGAFVIEQLKKDDENLSDFKKVISDNFENFLTREADKELMAKFIKNLRKSVEVKQRIAQPQIATEQFSQNSKDDSHAKTDHNQGNLLDENSYYSNGQNSNYL